MGRTFEIRGSCNKPMRDDEYGRRQRSNYHPRDPESETWADADPVEVDEVPTNGDNYDTAPVNTNT